ncbi:TetR/AcrR family transcriptional regulator [Nocardia uniformis]|uniref:TetR/AcrR family transcriptional regulator n=1 Tax=Nocardia uniformis TaxID=53432 RepID=A0A849CJL0_9NOCA|nr:TetR/AcrR family transcriptional regulator [Nocardia uniformis]NNH74701.1 TetR/AcrR family transcriptional regulator [Nocardia uniformis]
MTTPPTTSSNTRESTDSVEARILDAALVQFEQVGIKKTTIEDIARRAGVDRVTVYRRVGSRDDVVQIVATREVQRVLAALAEIAERHSTLPDLVADLFVTVVTRWRTHPLVDRMLSLEPERLLPQLTTAGAPSFTMAVATTATLLQGAVDSGLLPDSPGLLTRAEIVCRFVHSLILQPDGSIPLATTAELDTFARDYLVPIIQG